MNKPLSACRRAVLVGLVGSFSFLGSPVGRAQAPDQSWKLKWATQPTFVSKYLPIVRDALKMSVDPEPCFTLVYAREIRLFDRPLAAAVDRQALSWALGETRKDHQNDFMDLSNQVLEDTLRDSFLPNLSAVIAKGLLSGPVGTYVVAASLSAAATEAIKNLVWTPFWDENVYRVYKNNRAHCQKDPVSCSDSAFTAAGSQYYFPAKERMVRQFAKGTYNPGRDGYRVDEYWRRRLEHRYQYEYIRENWETLVRQAWAPAANDLAAIKSSVMACLTESPTTSLTVEVREEKSGLRIAGATVSLDSATLSGGYVTFKDVGIGGASHTLTVTAPGYMASRTSGLRLTSTGQTVTVSLAREPEPPRPNTSRPELSKAEGDAICGCITQLVARVHSDPGEKLVIHSPFTYDPQDKLCKGGYWETKGFSTKRWWPVDMARDNCKELGKLPPEGTSLPTVPAGTSLPTIENGTDRPGRDYRRTVEPAGADACRKACQADPACRAYTYVNPPLQGPVGICYLKNAVPNAVPNSSCVSGIKR